MSEVLITGALPLVLYSILVVAAAGVVRGYIGFGFSALCVASLSLFLPMGELVPVVLMLEVCASVLLIPSVWRHVHWRFAIGLTLCSVLAAPLGVAALQWLPAHVVRLCVLAVIALACVLLHRGYTLEGRQSPGRIALVGLVAGAVNGAGAVGGLIYSLFLIADGLPPAQFRASLVMIFLLVDVMSTLIMAQTGLLQTAHFQWLLVLVPPLSIGIFLGSRLFAKVSPQSFKKLVVRLLMVLVVVGLVSTLVPLIN